MKVVKRCVKDCGAGILKAAPAASAGDGVASAAGGATKKTTRLGGRLGTVDGVGLVGLDLVDGATFVG